MQTNSEFCKTLLSVYLEWQAFLSEANGSRFFTYAGLPCYGLFEKGNWTVIVYDVHGCPFEYTRSAKATLIRDFAEYVYQVGA